MGAKWPGADAPAFEPATPFVLTSPDETLVARGAGAVLDGDFGTLTAEVASFLRSREADGDAPVLVGALPFDRTRKVHLFEPRVAVLTRGSVLSPPSPERGSGGTWAVEASPSRSDYERAVAAALLHLHENGGVLRKVVLARRLIVDAPEPLDPAAILARLKTDRSATGFCVPLPTGNGAPSRALVGATPELLVRREGLSVLSVPLAGSARRHRDAGADEAESERLLRSDKDAREHATVVEWIADRLTPYCTTLTVPRRPSLVSTQTMWHLATRIRGELRERSVSSIELAAALHPTPAVCGLPVDLARRTIRELEPFDRGFFTGAVGWCAANGDGQWMVAIRCAEISGHRAALFAGAGIVEGSEPATEADETSAKFTALLQALSLDEPGAPVSKEGT